MPDCAIAAGEQAIETTAPHRAARIRTRIQPSPGLVPHGRSPKSGGARIGGRTAATFRIFFWNNFTARPASPGAVVKMEHFESLRIQPECAKGHRHGRAGEEETTD